MAGGVAYASIPDSSGVVHACYLKSGGALRVIDNTVADCKSNETALSWSQTGPKGASGARGPTGANGTNGTNGAPGPPGAAGTSGAAHAYFATNSRVIDGQGENEQRFVTLANLPAGSYSSGEKL